jgi:hypothetical protein
VTLTLTTSQARGVRDVLRILGKVEPELKKAAQKRLKAAAVPVQTEARQLIPNRPMSGWKPGGRIGWDQRMVARSITIMGPRGGKGRRVVLVALKQNSAAGAIYEKAGRKSSGTTRSGKAFVEALNRNNGPASRAVWRAVDHQRPQLEQAIQQAIEDTVAMLEQAVQAVK